MKLPWFPFYPRDWYADPKLVLTSASTRGIWMDLLCAMSIEEESEISGTLEELARVTRSTVADVTTFLREAARTKFCDVSECNQPESGIATECNLTRNHDVTDGNPECNRVYTIRCRRFAKQTESREKNREKVRRHRARRHQEEADNTDVPESGNANVTEPRNPPVLEHTDTEADTETDQKKEKQAKEKNSPDSRRVTAAVRDAEDWFERKFIPAYPPHRLTQEKSALAWLRKRPPTPFEQVAIIARLEAWKLSDEWVKENGEYVPGMARFLTERKYQNAPTSRASPKAPSIPTADDYWGNYQREA